MKESMKETVTDTLIVKVIYGDIITSFSFKCIGHDSIEQEHIYREDVSSVMLDEDETQYFSKYKTYNAIRECMSEAFDDIESAYDRGDIK